jgi:YbgC/YbaW family acyl-CoA thioester hydrolase
MLTLVSADNSPPVFTHHRSIEFADTDAGGIVHFSRYLVIMEAAEHAMLRRRGLQPLMEVEGQTIGWPRVEANCRYLSPARLGDDLDIEVRVERRGERSMTYGFRVLRGAEILAEGRMASVCCILRSDRPPEAIPFPNVIAEKLPSSTP